MMPLFDRIGLTLTLSAWVFTISARLIEQVNTWTETGLVIIGAAGALVGILRLLKGAYAGWKRVDQMAETVMDLPERLARIEGHLELEPWELARARAEAERRKQAA